MLKEIILIALLIINVICVTSVIGTMVILSAFDDEIGDGKRGM